MSSHASLGAAAQDRKNRLAQLKSLKRKQAPTSEETPDSQPTDNSPSTPKPTSRSPSPSATPTYLSGRNYDASTRAPKLGFENIPSSNQITLESQAKQLAETTKREAEEEEKADKPLDLFKLQPKKPNWDLKRDLARKLEVLNVRTDNAIARMVKERVERQRREELDRRQKETGEVGKDANGDGEAVGMQGSTLVQVMREREREEEQDERREREDEQRETEDDAL